MAFGHKDYIFSHTITKANGSHQPVTFKLDMSDLIGYYRALSPIFVIDSMTVTAYRQGTAEKIPVKFAVLNEPKTRVLTNDYQTFSSPWPVDVEPGVRVKIAGTDTKPFNRRLSVSDDQSKQAVLNALSFMASQSIWFADEAKGALEILSRFNKSYIHINCIYCLRSGDFHVLTDTYPDQQRFSFPHCNEEEDGGHVCVPSSELQSDREYQALCRVAALLRCASCDNLKVLTDITRKVCQYTALKGHSFPPRHQFTGDVVFPYALVKYVTCLYQTMLEYVDTFAIVDAQTPTVRVLIESPADNIGEVTGSLSLTLMYGYSAVHMEGHLRKEDPPPMGIDDSGFFPDVTQLSSDVLIRQFPLDFKASELMKMDQWHRFYYRSRDPMG